MSVEELIKQLERMPKDADVLMMGERVSAVSTVILQPEFFPCGMRNYVVICSEKRDRVEDLDDKVLRRKNLWDV